MFANTFNGFGWTREPMTLTMSGDDKSFSRLVWDSSEELFEEVRDESNSDASTGVMGITQTLVALLWLSKEKLKGFTVKKLDDRLRELEHQVISKQNTKGFRSAMSKVLKALSEGGALDDIVLRFIDREQCGILKKLLEERRLVPDIHVSTHWAKGFDFLNRALCGEISEEMAWWHCAWLMTEPLVEEMLRIEKRLDADIPLADEHIDQLSWHIRYGHPTVLDSETDDGKTRYNLYLDIDVQQINLYPLNRLAYYVLLQPAFILAQKFQEKCRIPRFIKCCRAPSCGKRFYTGRAKATSCPGSTGGKKSKCALEWVRYNRYLEKIGKVPEECWHEADLQKQFLVYDKS